VTSFFKSEVSEHLMAGFGYSHAGGWSMELSAYYKEVDDLRPRFENLFDPTGFLPEVQADRVLVAPTHAEMTGIEVGFRGDVGDRWAWSAGYALASAEDEVDGGDVPRSWEQRHAVDASLSADLENGWGFGLAGTYHSGWPTTGATVETIDDEIVIVPGPRNDERFSSYVRLDAHGKRDFRFGRHLLSFRAFVLNLLDRRNACCVEGFEPIPAENGPELERLEKRSLSRTVSLGAVWEF
jgi:outer membrane receptor protein involved in Fe transport